MFGFLFCVFWYYVLEVVLVKIRGIIVLFWEFLLEVGGRF